MKHYIFYTLLSLELCCMSCGKTPPLQIERAPYNGSLRTDGFYYYTYCPKSQWDTATRTYVFFLYRDGTWIDVPGFNNIEDVNEITVDSIRNRLKDFSPSQGRWGMFQEFGNTLYWNTWPFGPRQTTAIVYSATVLNDTTFVRYPSNYPYQKTDTNIYHFHQFPYKPDSSVTYQWW